MWDTQVAFIDFTDYRTSQDENITANADYSIDVEFYILELSGKARSSLVAYNIEVSYLGPPDIHPGDINYTDPVYQVQYNERLQARFNAFTW